MNSSPLRRHPKAKRPRRQRPGVTPPMPKGWLGLAARIRVRDGQTCRWCGAVSVFSGAVDHVIPRRLLVGRETATPANLALLCSKQGCHAHKTQVIEPALYCGDILAFDHFLSVLAISGPIPSPSLRARAYKRLGRLLDAQAR